MYFLYGFYAAAVIFSGYYLFFMCYHAVGIKKTVFTQNPIAVQGVSILIPVRNDAKQITQLLDCLLIQKNVFVPVQILIIDDHSQDDLYTVLQPYLHTVEYLPLPQEKQGKKQAIEHGILQAKHEIIITTDADCTMHEEWLYTLLSCFEEQVQFVSAPVLLQANTLFEKIQQIELMGLVGIGAGAIYYHKPNLCNGANLAYRKSAFNAVNGYEGSRHLASGDDELLMHKIHAYFNKKRGIVFCKNFDAIVYTPAQHTLKQFLQQRKRWISKARHYQRKGLTTQLVLLYSFYIVLLVSSMLSLWFIDFLYISTTLWTIKILAEYSIMIQMFSFFRQKTIKNTVIFLISQMFQCMYVLWAGIVSLRPAFIWKERKYE